MRHDTTRNVWMTGRHESWGTVRVVTSRPATSLAALTYVMRSLLLCCACYRMLCITSHVVRYVWVEGVQGVVMLGWLVVCGCGGVGGGGPLTLPPKKSSRVGLHFIGKELGPEGGAGGRTPSLLKWGHVVRRGSAATPADPTPFHLSTPCRHLIVACSSYGSRRPRPSRGPNHRHPSRPPITHCPCQRVLPRPIRAGGGPRRRLVVC